MRVFLAAPWHRPDDEARLGQLIEVVKAAGHDPLVPGAGRLPESLAGADAVVALLDGAAPDPEVAFALGHARARGLPALGLRSDPRAPAGGVHAGVYAEGLTSFAQGPWKDLESALFGFLVQVPPRSQETLVRDRVPTRLRQENAAFEMRRVEGREHAEALKRRLLLETERLLVAPEGDEREHLAEALELVETLLELRHYDPAGLRRLKQRLEDEEGGYAQGYLVKSG